MTRRIAVLGGGIGALSTVYALTSEPDWRGRFDIDVYVHGWRLGGKGASGRNVAMGHRIQEHGLHIWMGFYHNAFRVMRDVYAERAASVADPGIFATWRDAFEPQALDVLIEQVKGQPSIWQIAHGAKPGEPGDASPELGPWLHMLAALDQLRGYLHETPHAAAVAEHAARTGAGLLSCVARRLERGIDACAAVGSTSALDVARHVAAALGPDVAGHAAADHALLVALLDHARDAVQTVLSRLDPSDATRHLKIVLDLGLTLLRGTLAERVIANGFDPLDAVDFRAWLRTHGAADDTIESAILDSLYTAGFCYSDGSRDRPDMAAGVALQCLLRLALCQRGPFSWKMRAGMGDVVFSPLYQVLAARGVKFHFFHRVKRLAYDPATNTVARIEMDEQVRLDRPYDPLIHVAGVDAWPSAPRIEFIHDGDALASLMANNEIDLESRWSPAWRGQRPATLTRGSDYDDVVLGISLGALGELCAEIVDAKPAWATMVREVRTVITQAQQLWFTPTVAELGWPTGPAVVQGYPAPMGQWLDASHVLPRETWPAGTGPGAVLYFCDVWPDGLAPPASDHLYPGLELARVVQGCREWLDRYPGTTWPKAVQPGTSALNMDVLYDETGATGDARVASQYFRVNLEPSERFVQSASGSTVYRLTADGSGVDGLFLTGDWIRNGFNVGCVEATVISGLQCARAIDGRPRDIVDEHFLRLRPVVTKGAE